MRITDFRHAVAFAQKRPAKFMLRDHQLLNLKSQNVTATTRRGSPHFQALSSAALLIILIAALIIAFNGGISVGFSNHAGLLPVVRRILNPNYLPGDFGITLRFYHHRVFAYLVAGFSAVLGEDNGLIALAAIGVTLLSASLFALCRVLNIGRLGFVVAGLFLATRLAWTGLGLEENTFAGNADIMPTTFAHAALLLATASLLKERYKLTVFLAGTVLLLHLQIGLIFAMVLLPFFAGRLKLIPPGELAAMFVLFIVSASPALIHFFKMLASGLSNSSFTLDYINFRHPHHFELQSAANAVWVSAHLTIQCAVYYWLKKRSRPEAAAIGLLMKASLIIGALSLLHFLDYYVLQIGTISKIQLLRLSPLITLFGTLSLITAVTSWEDRQPSEERPSTVLRPATSCLIAVALLWSGYYLIRWPSDVRFGINRYASQNSSWVDMCLWIRDHGPAGTTYLTPPDKGGFTYLTNRSTVVEFKINPDGGLYLAEWYQRLRDVCGSTLPDGRGFGNYSKLREAYGSLNSDQLAVLGNKYGAGCAVLPATSPIGLETLHQNGDYKLVIVPGDRGN